MPIYSHHGKKGSRPYITPCLLFCHAVTSWLASLESSGFSSFYNVIVLMGALEAWRWWRICASQAGIPQHGFVFFGSALCCYQETLQPFTPWGLMWIGDCWHKALAYPLPFPISLERAIVYREKIDPSIDPLQRSLLLCCFFKPWGVVLRLRNGAEEKAAAKGRDGKGKGFLPSPLLFVYWHGTNLIS